MNWSVHTSRGHTRRIWAQVLYLVYYHMGYSNAPRDQIQLIHVHRFYSLYWSIFSKSTGYLPSKSSTPSQGVFYGLFLSKSETDVKRAAPVAVVLRAW